MTPWVVMTMPVTVGSLRVAHPSRAQVGQLGPRSSSSLMSKIGGDSVVSPPLVVVVVDSEPPLVESVVPDEVPDEVSVATPREDPPS